MNCCSSRAVSASCRGAAFGKGIPIPVMLVCLSAELALPAGHQLSLQKVSYQEQEHFFPELEERSSPVPSPPPSPALSSPLLHLPATCSRHLPSAKNIEKAGTDL